MSMLSSQVDRLRELAARYDELQADAVKAVTMPSDMGSILRDAADTIWELRDELQRANAENAKLRACLGNDCADCAVGMGEYADSICDKIKVENAKLRELVKRVISRFNDINREFWGNQEPLPCDLCKMERQCSEVPQHDRCLFYEYLRDLGVEVDDG